MEGMLSKIWEMMALYGIRVIGAIIILVVGRWVAIGIKNLIRRGMDRSKLDQTPNATNRCCNGPTPTWTAWTWLK